MAVVFAVTCIRKYLLISFSIPIVRYSMWSREKKTFHLLVFNFSMQIYVQHLFLSRALWNTNIFRIANRDRIVLYSGWWRRRCLINRISHFSEFAIILIGTFCERFRRIFKNKCLVASRCVMMNRWIKLPAPNSKIA